MRRLMIATAAALFPLLAFPCQPNGNDTTRTVQIVFEKACNLTAVPNPLPIKVGQHRESAKKIGERTWEATFGLFVRPNDGLVLPPATLNGMCCAKPGQKPVEAGRKDCVAVFTVTCDVPAWKLDISSQPTRTFSFARMHRDDFDDPFCTREDLSPTTALNELDERDTVIISLREEGGRYILRLPITSGELAARGGQRPYTSDEMKRMMEEELKISRGTRAAQSYIERRERMLPNSVLLRRVTR